MEEGVKFILFREVGREHRLVIPYLATQVGRIAEQGREAGREGCILVFGGDESFLQVGFTLESGQAPAFGQQVFLLGDARRHSEEQGGGGDVESSFHIRSHLKIWRENTTLVDIIMWKNLSLQA